MVSLWLYIYIQGTLATFCLQRDIYRKTKPAYFDPKISEILLKK